MGRIVNVKALEGMTVGRRGADEHLQFSFTLLDDFIASNNKQKYRLSSSVDGKLQVEHLLDDNDSSPCFDLDVRGLAAMVYGVLDDPAELWLRGWGSPDATTQSVIKAMFPPITPYFYASF